MIKKYKEICNAIVVQFCAKQEMDFNGWTADEVGGIAECSDFYFNFLDILKDIEKKVDKGVIIDWYYSNIDNENNYINYNSWLMGLRHEKLDVNQSMKDLNKKIKKASKNWKGVNVDEFIDEVKGISDKPNVSDSFNHETISKIRNSKSDAEARRMIIEELKKADRN